jgi:prepilin-type N-terminal cleavage/methylation domain-containing protein
MRMRRKGFTLIELLVVVAIIVILAGILYPVFAATRRAAYNSVCLSNLKQIGLAVQMYTQDYDESFPTACSQDDRITGRAQPLWPTPTPYLWEVVAPYVKNAGVWRCPADRGYKVPALALNFEPSTYAKTGSSYQYNTNLAWASTGFLGRRGSWLPLTVGAIQTPAETMVAAEPEGTGYWHNSILAPVLMQRNAGNDTTNTYRFNQVSVDGHVQSFTLAQVQILWRRSRDQF